MLDLAFVVLHTSPLDEPGTKDAGGMNVVVLAQAAELARLGHHVKLITRRSDPDQPAVREVAPRLTVHSLDVGPAKLLKKGDHEALIEPFSEALTTLVQAQPVSLIHAEHWYSGLAALPVAQQLRIPLVQSFHSIAAAVDTPFAEGERPEAPGRLAGERRLATAATRVVTVSEAERRTVIERLGGPPEHVRVVPPGVDTEVFRPATDRCTRHQHRGACCKSDSAKAETRTRSLQVPSEQLRPEVLVIGRLDPLKRFDLAIAAVAAITPERRPVLRIIGAAAPDGEAYERSLREAVGAADMLESTYFDGALPRAALAERLRQAALVLVPSYSETFGLVALEAAAAGVPVIAAAAGGLREAVIDGETGVLIESEDPVVWAARLEHLLSDAEGRTRMGRLARAHAERHGWAVSTRRLLEVYRELV